VSGLAVLTRKREAKVDTRSGISNECAPTAMPGAKKRKEYRGGRRGGGGGGVGGSGREETAASLASSY
jgi:hypothetical protein